MLELMMTTGIKFIVSLLMMPISFFLMQFTGWFAVGLIIGVIFSILYCIDYAEELRGIESASKAQKIILFFLTVPQVLIGLSIFIIGASIIVWVLYNNFVEQQPQFSGGILAFGMAPLFVLFGIGLIASAAKNRTKPNDEL